MTRQDQIWKWTVYALWLLPVWVLDVYLLGRWPLYGVKPMLLPLAVAAVAVLEGAVAGARFGMAVGLLWVLSCPGSATILILLMAVAGMLCGAAAQDVLTQNFAGYLICGAGVLVSLEALRILWSLFIQLAPLPVLLEVAGKELAWSLAWTPVVYLAFRRAFVKVGLDKLA